MSNQTNYCRGLWKVRGDAATLIIEKQAEFKEKHPCYRGKFSKERTIELLLCELYAIKQKEKEKEKAA